MPRLRLVRPFVGALLALPLLAAAAAAQRPAPRPEHKPEDDTSPAARAALEEVPVATDPGMIAIAAALRRLREKPATPQDAIVRELRAAPGDLLEQGYVLLLHRRVPPLEDGQRAQILSKPQRDALIAAMAQTDRSRLLAGIAQRARVEPPGPFALAALPVLGAVGEARHVTDAVAVYEAATEDAYAEARREAFEEAVTAILARDDRAFERVAGALRRAQAPTRKSLALALGETRRAAALEGLLQAARMDRTLTAALLGLLPKIGLCAHKECWTELSDRALDQLGEPGNQRGQAALAAGTIGDPRAVEPLIELLETGTQGERGNAHAALCKIAALQYPAQVAPWRAWYQAEERWKAREFEKLLVQARGARPTEACAALRTLCEHPLYRHEIAGELDDALESPSSEIVAEAVRCAGRLRSPLASGALCRLFETEEEWLVELACAALAEIHGKDLPRVAVEWRAEHPLEETEPSHRGEGATARR